MHAVAVSHTDLLLVLLGIGTVGGFLSGMLGFGGGIVFVPALFYALRAFFPGDFPVMHVAVATSLSLVLATSLSSVYWQSRRGSVDFTLLKKWSASKVIGVLLGTFLASYVRSAFLRQLFAFVMVSIAAYVTFGRDRDENAPVVSRVSDGMQQFLSGATGTLSAMLGVGGGTLNIPLMKFVGMPIRKSVGTSGGLAVVTALPGVIGYIALGLYKAPTLPPYCIGYVNWLALVCILPATMVCSPIGVHLSHKIPQKVLRRLFSLVLLIVSWRMFTS